MNEIFDNVGKVLLGAFGLVILVVAVRTAAGSKKAQYAETARTGANVFVAMVFVAIGFGAIGYAAFGEKILGALGIR